MIHDRILAHASRALAHTLQAGLVVGGLALGTGLAQAQTQAPTTNDSQLQAAVSAALAADTQLHGQQITATAAGGVVTLSGTVAQDEQRLAAEQTAAQVAGVKSINDSLAVAGDAPAPADAGTVAQANQGPAQAGPPADGTATADQGAQASMPPPPPADSAAQQQQYPQQGSQYPQQGQYPQQNGAQQYPQGQYPQQGGQYPQQQAGQYPQQQAGQYPQQQGGYPGQYAPYTAQGGQYAPPAQPQPYMPAVQPERQNASGPVTLAPGLLLSVRTSQPLSTSHLKAGDLVQFTSASDVYANGVVAVPRGAVFTGEVVEAKNAGALGGSAKLDLKLTTVSLGNQTYPLQSDVWSSQGPSKTGYTATNTVGGAAFGALIGAIAGGGVGAGVGAIAGGATGMAVSGATHGPRLDLPAEALLQFHLAAPLTVQPVSYSEAQRIAASAPQVPVLRTRPAYVAAPYPYYARPYYYGPPVYYRPY